MLPDECAEQFAIFQSPVGQTSNRLLWGDWEKGEFGVVVRSFDIFDRGTEYEQVLKEVFDVEKNPNAALQYLPATYLHASLRPSKAIFLESEEAGIGVIVGTKYKKNWAMADYQREDAVDCASYYPSDAGTMARGVLETGTDCSVDLTMPICVDDECLADHDSACGGCKVAPERMGDLVARFYEKENRTDRGLTLSMCDYPDVDQMVVASNSVWKERSKWWDSEAEGGEYEGYTECPASLNIRDREMLDALVVPLYTRDSESMNTMCDYGDHRDIDTRLQLAWNHTYGGLPVLFYHETLGMRKAEDCVRFWGGKDCNDGWQKEFFSQEYNFDSNACIHRPPDCQEAYYFPPDGEECSAFTEAGKTRIEELCAREKHMDAFLAAQQGGLATYAASLRSGAYSAKGRERPSMDAPFASSLLIQCSFLVIGAIFSLFIRGKMVISLTKDWRDGTSFPSTL